MTLATPSNMSATSRPRRKVPRTLSFLTFSLLLTASPATHARRHRGSHSTAAPSKHGDHGMLRAQEEIRAARSRENRAFEQVLTSYCRSAHAILVSL